MPDQYLADKKLLASIAPVVPVADFVDAAHATAVCELYGEAAVPSVEVTLRRENAWEGFAAAINTLPEAQIGVGTFVDTEQLRQAFDMVASFAISPGISESLVTLAQQLGIAYFPGIATASELMLARQLGLRAVEFFPAAAAGGINMLKSLAAPFGDMAFCPTGGINVDNYKNYLALANVSCVGGSWVIPSMERITKESDKVLSELKSVYQS